MENNIEVLTGFTMHYQVFGGEADKHIPQYGYLFNGHIGFKKDTKMDEAITKVRKTIEDDGRTVVFYSVECANVKKFNDEV